MAISIRLAKAEDLPVIVEFGIAMARETEAKELDREITTRGVQSLLRDRSKGFYVIAERGGRIAGSLMITTEWSDWRNGEYWWIQSVYVHPEFRRQGIYRELHKYIRDLANSNSSVHGLRLYVEKHNTGAQQTYLANGMSEAKYMMFEEYKD